MNGICELMTVRDVAAALKLSTRTIWRMRATGEIPQPIRVGRSVRWQRCEVEHWVIVKQEEADAHDDRF